MKIVVRTHGGLGNQIFQILYARLCAKKYSSPYVELHDSNYSHRFERSKYLIKSETTPGLLDSCISSLRIPKLVNKFYFIGKARKESVKFGRLLVLDGYFQHIDDYYPFSDTDLSCQFEVLRRELDIAPRKKVPGSCLYHVRLGDFFSSTSQAVQYLNSTLATMAPNSTVISNQEELFESSQIQRLLSSIGVEFKSTKELDPENVLRIMSSYERLHSNNSTLAFWASVLGGCSSTFSHPKLSAIHDKFFAVSNIIQD